MTIALCIGSCTLQGIRPQNEDALLVKRYPDATVCLLADGMGGTNVGRIASRRVVEVVSRELRCRIPQVADREQARQIIWNAVICANEDLLARSVPGQRMGSTLVGGVWRNESEIYLTNAGDSRA
jgi:protein phosphatase